MPEMRYFLFAGGAKQQAVAQRAPQDLPGLARQVGYQERQVCRAQDIKQPRGTRVQAVFKPDA